MRTVTCEVCKRSVPLTSDILASAALDHRAEMLCACGATIEATYTSESVLLTATAPRVIRFGASGPMTFSRPDNGGVT